MKKLITICLFMATTFTVNAQTEEETISWLKEKLTKNIVGDTKYQITVTPCEITIGGDAWLLKIPTDAQVTFKSDGDGVQGVSTNGARMTRQNSDGTHYFGGVYGRFELVEVEADLRARVKKAIEHLATFCPKKKETF